MVRNIMLAIGITLEAASFTSHKMPDNYHRVSRRSPPIEQTINKASWRQRLASESQNAETFPLPNTALTYLQDIFPSEEGQDTVLDSIDEEIYERETAIDNFAEELIWTYGCPQSLADAQDLLYSAAATIEDIFHPTLGADNLQLELSSILDDRLNVSNSNGSIASQLASARYAETCLGVENNELLDKYRDYFHSLEERDCRQAEEIATELQDVVRRLETLRTCYGTDEFYAQLKHLPDDELALSSRGLPRKEYDRWRMACDYLRRHRGLPSEQAFVSCLADIALGSLPDEVTTPYQLGITSGDMEELISFLPSSDVQRICALRASVQQAQYKRGRTSVDPETFFEQCVENEME